MKTEAEIREHRNALRDTLRLPCGCSVGCHAAECYIGGLNMAAAEAVLCWVLGESSERYDRTVHEVNQAALEIN